MMLPIIYDCPNVNCTTPIYTGECRPECWERNNKEMGKKPLTNGDRIRQMTDEELAKMYSGTILCVPEGRCRGNPKTSCYECWLNWLKQPKEEA